MERLDNVDPRLFVPLPEHASSQANYLWNCALLMSQMTNLKNTHVQSKSGSKKAASNGNGDSLEAVLYDLKLKYGTANANRLLNETLNNLARIKKRNKASFFNLTLWPTYPVGYYVNGRASSHQQYQNPLVYDYMTMETPWMYYNMPELVENATNTTNKNTSSSSSYTDEEEEKTSDDRKSEQNVGEDDDEEEETGSKHSDFVKETDDVSSIYEHGFKR